MIVVSFSNYLIFSFVLFCFNSFLTQLYKFPVKFFILKYLLPFLFYILNCMIYRNYFNSDCYKKVPWLIHSRNVLLSFWKLEVRDEDMSMVRLLLVHYWLSIAVSSHDKEQRKRKQDLSCLFIKALIPFISIHHYNIIPYQSPHILMPSHWGVGFQYIHFGQTQAFSSLQ